MESLILKGLKVLGQVKRKRYLNIRAKGTTSLDSVPLREPKKKQPKEKIKRTKKQKQDTKIFGMLITQKMGERLQRHTERNKDINHINHKIYHLLFHPFTHINAYTRISKNSGVLTKGIKSDQEVNRFFGQEKAITIANKFKEKNYDWMPARRTMIPKPGKKDKRPIDTPTQENRVAQEALRGILEAIYEPVFRDFEESNNYLCTNYGFRPQLSTQHAIDTIKNKAQGAVYIIEGDITKAYNSMSHNIFLSILQNRIKDKQFLKTIRQLLECGIMVRNQQLSTLIGTPQGGIASPLIFNIYMHELDKFVYQEIIMPILASNEVKKKQPNREHKNLGQLFKRKLTILRNTPTSELVTRKGIKSSLKEIEARRFKLPSHVPESLPRTALYTRYADDWVIAVTATHAQATEIKEKVAKFLQVKLEMQLDPKKTLISRLEDGFDFLGFTIQSWSSDQNKITSKLITYKDKPSVRFKQRTTSRKITTAPCAKRILTNLVRNNFCQGSEYFPIAKAAWTALDEYEIVLKFRQTFLGIYNYYCLADRTYILNRVSYILKFSCAKTLAYRKKRHIPQIFAEYGSNLTITREFQGKDKTNT